MHTCKGPMEAGGGRALGSGARWEGVRGENTRRQRMRRGADQPGQGEGRRRHAWPSGDPPRSQRARCLQPATAGRQTEASRRSFSGARPAGDRVPLCQELTGHSRSQGQGPQRERARAATAKTETPSTPFYSRDETTEAGLTSAGYPEPEQLTLKHWSLSLSLQMSGHKTTSMGTIT